MNVYPNVDFEPSAPVLTDKECEQIYKYNPELSSNEYEPVFTREKN